MNKELWKKVYRACRLFISAGEISPEIKPLLRPFSVYDDNTTRTLSIWIDRLGSYELINIFTYFRAGRAIIQLDNYNTNNCYYVRENA